MFSVVLVLSCGCLLASVLINSLNSSVVRLLFVEYSAGSLIRCSVWFTWVKSAFVGRSWAGSMLLFCFCFAEED